MHWSHCRAVAAGAQLDKESRDAEGAGTQCYLSSYKLFGLQLTDSAFRRDFLVQVGFGVHRVRV